MNGSDAYAKRVLAAHDAAAASEREAMQGVGLKHWELLSDTQQRQVRWCLNWCRYRGGPDEVLTLAEVRAIYANRLAFIDALPGDWPQRMRAIHIAAGKRLAADNGKGKK